MVAILPRLLPLICFGLLALTAVPASAVIRTETFRTGPIEVGGYEVKQRNADLSIPEPNVGGFITHMEVDVVDEDGTPVPLHNVTLADGPRGFSSEHLSDGRTCRKRLTVPGRYKLFCGLHPVSMTQTVRVR